MMWHTTACSCNGARRYIGWSRWPSRSCTAVALPSTTKCWPITMSGRRSGARPWNIWSRPDRRRSKPTPTRRPWRTMTERHWTVWARGLACCGRGEYEQAMVSLQEGLRLSAQLGDKAAKPRILNSLGWLYGELYNLETAVRYNQEAAEAAYAIGEPELVAYAE